MFKIYYTQDYFEIVETMEDAVGLGWGHDAFVAVMNRPKVGTVEAERIVYERISCLGAEDEWVGARFESDVVPPFTRIARKGIRLGRNNIPGHVHQKVRMTSVRA